VLTIARVALLAEGAAAAVPVPRQAQAVNTFHPDRRVGRGRDQIVAGSVVK
jgi:hypothetical protein